MTPGKPPSIFHPFPPLKQPTAFIVTIMLQHEASLAADLIITQLKLGHGNRLTKTPRKPAKNEQRIGRKVNPFFARGVLTFGSGVGWPAIIMIIFLYFLDTSLDQLYGWLVPTQSHGSADVFFDDFPDFTLGDFFFSFQPFIFRGVTPILIRFGDVLQYHKNSMLGRWVSFQVPWPMSEVMLVSGRVIREQKRPNFKHDENEASYFTKKKLDGFKVFPAPKPFGIIFWTHCMWASSKLVDFGFAGGVFLQSYGAKMSQTKCQTVRRIGTARLVWWILADAVV